MNEDLHPLEQIEQKIARQLNRGDFLIDPKARNSQDALDAFARIKLRFDAGDFTVDEFESVVREYLEYICRGSWSMPESHLRNLARDNKGKKEYEEEERFARVPESERNYDRVEDLLRRAGPLEDPWPDLTNHQKAFLLKLMDIGNLARACVGGVTVIHHYNWLRSSDAYREAYEDVRRYFADQALERLTDLAFNGEMLEDPHHTDGNGRPIKKRRYDRRLLIFLIIRQDKKDQATHRPPKLSIAA